MNYHLFSIEGSNFSFFKRLNLSFNKKNSVPSLLRGNFIPSEVLISLWLSHIISSCNDVIESMSLSAFVFSSYGEDDAFVLAVES